MRHCVYSYTLTFTHLHKQHTLVGVKCFQGYWIRVWASGNRKKKEIHIQMSLNTTHSRLAYLQQATKAIWLGVLACLLAWQGLRKQGSRLYLPCGMNHFLVTEEKIVREAWSVGAHFNQVVYVNAGHHAIIIFWHLHMKNCSIVSHTRLDQ